MSACDGLGKVSWMLPSELPFWIGGCTVLARSGAWVLLATARISCDTAEIRLRVPYLAPCPCEPEWLHTVLRSCTTALS